MTTCLIQNNKNKIHWGKGTSLKGKLEVDPMGFPEVKG